MENTQPVSRLRLLVLLAIAHALLVFYLWFCAFDLELVLLPGVRLWMALAWSWATWPVLMVFRAAAARLAVLRRAFALRRSSAPSA
jgi:hypothetical protein